MTSYTFGDPKGIDTAIMNLKGEKYPMELNTADFRTICNSLLFAHDFNGSELAGDLLSGILSTLDVEYI